jgi:CxxC motif-containing protein
MKKAITCIGCPIGCQLVAKWCKEDYSDLVVNGFSCPIGKKYGPQEIISPRRVITTSVRIICNKKDEDVERSEDGKYYKMISVKTVPEIPKNQIINVLKEIKSANYTKADVQIGDILIKNILNLGSDLVVTRSA